MAAYRERLGVPAWWWLIALVIVVPFGTMLWTGLSPVVAAVIYGTVIVLTVAALLAWGSAVIEVTPERLRAGRARLPVSHAGRVTVLDKEQTAALRGPRADPAAFLLTRPFLPESVYIAVTGLRPEWPYLLLGTRRPAALAAAIEQARQAAGAGPACDDDATSDTGDGEDAHVR